MVTGGTVLLAVRVNRATVLTVTLTKNYELLKC